MIVTDPSGFDVGTFGVGFPMFLRSHGIEFFPSHELVAVGRSTMLVPANSERDRVRVEEIERIIGHDLPRTSVIEVRLSAPPPELWSNILPTLAVAERLRRDLRSPVFCNSAYRDPVYNAAVGGAPHSSHRAFNAMDIWSRAMDPHDLSEWLINQPEAGIMGIGVYPPRKDRTGFVHIDTRGRKARWSG